MRFQPNQTVWYLDQNGSVKVGAFMKQTDDKITLILAQGPPPITVLDANAFDTEVAASRAQIARASVHSNRPPTGGVSFIRK